MNNQYLVVKLQGNWIEREQIKRRIEMFVGDIDVLDDKDIVTCHDTQEITKELTTTKPSGTTPKKESPLLLWNTFLNKG